MSRRLSDEQLYFRSQTTRAYCRDLCMVKWFDARATSQGPVPCAWLRTLDASERREKLMLGLPTPGPGLPTTQAAAKRAERSCVQDSRERRAVMRQACEDDLQAASKMLGSRGDSSGRHLRTGPDGRMKGASMQTKSPTWAAAKDVLGSLSTLVPGYGSGGALDSDPGVPGNEAYRRQ